MPRLLFFFALDVLFVFAGRTAIRRYLEEAWRHGVVLEDGYRTAPAQVRLEGLSGKGAWLRVILREGRVVASGALTLRRASFVSRAAKFVACGRALVPPVSPVFNNCASLLLFREICARLAKRHITCDCWLVPCEERTHAKHTKRAHV